MYFVIKGSNNGFIIYEVTIKEKKEQGLSLSGDINPEQGYNKALVQKSIVAKIANSGK